VSEILIKFIDYLKCDKIWLLCCSDQ